MKLNLDYYKQDIFYNIEKSEEEIIKYIMEKAPNEYEEIIKKNISVDVVLALSTIRNNIVYAYEFKPNSTILEVGAHYGEITNALCQKASKVISIESVKARAEAISKRCENAGNLEVIVGNLKDIKLEEKFDYITLFGVLEFAQLFFDTENPALELLNYCKAMLKEDGKLLIATDNKFAIKSYVGNIDECTNNVFDSITGYKSSKRNYKMGKNEIEKILSKVGLCYYKFLYLLPDYKLTNIIFSDEYLPTSSKINAYFPYYRDESPILYSEIDAYDAIINDNKEMFKFFANSYFIEASQIEFENKTKFVSFNNYRKKKFRLMTKIKEDTVEKTFTVPESKQHIENINKNIQQLKDDGLRILDSFENDKIISKFISDTLLSEKICDNLENKKYILDLLKKYKNEISKLSHQYNEEEKTVFDKYSIEIKKEILSKFNYLEKGYWDMILKNCFLIENEFVFFDQEWVEENVPVEFLIYRCIVNIEKLRDKIEEYKLYEELGIDEYIPIFKKLDEEIANEIFDDKIFELYTRKHINPIYENGKLKEELNYEKNTTRELEKSIKNLSNEIYDKDRELGEKENIIKKLQETLEGIYASRSWKMLQKINKLLKR